MEQPHNPVYGETAPILTHPLHQKNTYSQTHGCPEDADFAVCCSKAEACRVKNHPMKGVPIGTPSEPPRVKPTSYRITKRKAGTPFTDAPADL